MDETDLMTFVLFDIDTSTLLKKSLRFLKLMIR